MIVETVKTTDSSSPVGVRRGKTVEELVRTVSASRLNTFHSCRLKFYFAYVAGIPRRKSAALHVGSSVHHVLKLWNLHRWRRVPIPDGSLKAQFEEYWTSHQVEEPITWDTDEEEDSKTTAWNLLTTYFKQTPIPGNESAEGVEVSVNADLGSTQLIGIIDLVRSRARIVEFKTSATTPNPDKAEHLHELQCSCYAVMYRNATGTKERSIELHHLVKLKTPKLVVTELPPMSGKSEARLMRAVDSYLDGVYREDWVPNPNPMTCACCEFFNECRRWS